jgi:hypothetical protein
MEIKAANLSFSYLLSNIKFESVVEQFVNDEGSLSYFIKNPFS